MENDYGFYDAFCDLSYLNQLPKAGLCNSLSKDLLNEAWHLMVPTDAERYQLLCEDLSSIFWASGCTTDRNNPLFDNYDRKFKFTELRQTILLLCACMNEEEIP